MSNYRRARVPGAAYFFTVALADRHSRVLVEEIDRLRSAFAATLREHPVEVRAMVVLPDHLHAVWALPEGDADFPIRWWKLKARFSRALGGEWRRTQSQIAKRERGLWQRRYWEHMIRGPEDMRRHVEYCWLNPVRHGLVTRVRDWPHSSFHRDARLGLVPEDWAGGP
ncbi:MAG: transposase [Rhodovulum sulfidophilum]|uniref:Transposase n=1 Tax=Rhodovulum sulfidophilum TaxID=35806 RepID=A0A2W5NI14_RHOSU|nr:MAG: transposase [Rhodovulum sulfidophilum]